MGNTDKIPARIVATIQNTLKLNRIVQQLLESTGFQENVRFRDKNTTLN